MSPLALITGGQQGIGFGIAEALVAAGFRVALVAEVAQESEVVGEALARLGSEARYFQHDLRDVAHAEACIADVVRAMGPIDTFVSNAGVPAKVRGDMLEMLPENFDFVFDINLRGAFFLAQAAARHILATVSEHYRSMLFVTSVSAEMISIERAEYCMSKSAASMMAQLFAVRMAPHQIGVFELRPGIIETGMTAGVKDKYTTRIEGGLVPAARWGQPGDIGAAVVPLAIGQMAFSTGAVFPVDGGLSLSRL
jgi:NAD(P)-dependent dehydrogenase (short-subunit alcohol dehydrogenase family)